MDIIVSSTMGPFTVGSFLVRAALQSSSVGFQLLHELINVVMKFLNHSNHVLPVLPQRLGNIQILRDLKGAVGGQGRNDDVR